MMSAPIGYYLSPDDKMMKMNTTLGMKIIMKTQIMTSDYVATNSMDINLNIRLAAEQCLSPSTQRYGSSHDSIHNLTQMAVGGR